MLAQFLGLQNSLKKGENVQFLPNISHPLPGVIKIMKFTHQWPEYYGRCINFKGNGAKILCKSYIILLFLVRLPQ